MTKSELIKKLQEIKNKGYIQSTRSGTTGIGHTFETLLGISENNIAIPDIGARIEIKVTRRNSNNLITLFTFNKGVWKFPLKDIIIKYGYVDNKGRSALKNTLFYGKSSSANLLATLEANENLIHIVDNKGEIIGSYDLYTIVGKYITKLGRVLFVIADSKKVNKIEYFHFNEFYLLSETSSRKFIEAFKKGYIGIDLRMHIEPKGTVRNRGTGFRIKETHLIELYDKVEKIL